MPEAKKLIDYPLDEIDIPQAIRLMMMAATHTVSFSKNDAGPETETDNEMLAQLCEKLEARFEDELDTGISNAQPDITDEPEIFVDVDPAETTLLKDGTGDVYRVVHRGVVYGKLCNERVKFNEETGQSSTCIKEWGHETYGRIEHEDMEGHHR